LHSKTGCKTCGHDLRAEKKRRKNQREFIDRAKTIHGNWYDYSTVNYNLAWEKVTIICPKHGEFSQYPSQHLNGHRCKWCYWDAHPSKNHISHKEFVEAARRMHGNKYDYGVMKYKTTTVPITIHCNKHNKEIEINTKSHLKGITPECCRKEERVTLFLTRARKVHGDKYDYSKVSSINYMVDKVTIICPKHGEFKQRIPVHINGQADCPRCAVHSATFNLDVPTMLYYIKITDLDGTEYWKIGITSKQLNERYSKAEMKHIEVLWTRDYLTGHEAYQIEQFALNKYMNYRPFKKISVLVDGSGYTELFDRNVMGNIRV